MARTIQTIESLPLDRRSFVAASALLGASVILNPAQAWADEEDEETEEERREREEKEAQEKAEKEAKEAEEKAAREAQEKAEEKIAEAEKLAEQIVEAEDALAKSEEAYHKALDDHEQALADHEQALAAVEEAKEALAEANARIEAGQKILAERARKMYRDGQATSFDLILGATTFEEFARNWSLLAMLNDSDADLVRTTKLERAKAEELKAELEEQEARADESIDEAERVTEEAEKLKDEAEQTLLDLQELLEQVDAEVDALLEKAHMERATVAFEGSKRIYTYTSEITRDVPSYEEVCEYALSKKGCPYVWGAEGPDSFDCSGLVRWAYLQIGMSLPHQTEALYHRADARLPVSEARPGDVLWRGDGDGFNGHVGIALNEGGTHYVHAPNFNTVVRDTDDLSYSGFTHCLRFV